MFTGLVCGPFFKCVPLPNFVLDDMFRDVTDIVPVFKALNTGIIESLNSKMSNNFCKESTRPFRPILKALAATNDNWNGFFDTVSLSTSVGGGAGIKTASTEAGFAVDKNGDVACFVSVCTGVSTEVDPDIGFNVNLGVSSGTVFDMAGEGISVGVEGTFIAAGGGFSYGYGTDLSFGGVGFSLDV